MLCAMRAIVISNDVVRLSFLMALLRDGGVESVLLDNHTSVVEGSIGAIPRRLMVREEDERRALRILHEAGEASAAGESCEPGEGCAPGEG
jgi:hypothetical protein